MDYPWRSYENQSSLSYTSFRSALDIINKSISEYSQLLFLSPGIFLKRLGSDSIRLHMHQTYAKDLITNENKEDLATVHGFRSSFRDWVAEMTNHPRNILKKLWCSYYRIRSKLHIKEEICWKEGGQ